MHEPVEDDPLNLRSMLIVTQPQARRIKSEINLKHKKETAHSIHILNTDGLLFSALLDSISYI